MAAIIIMAVLYLENHS
ncbi:TPA: hypothetical protein ACXF60_002805 [Escherichia coli]